jgi:uncharacterized protein YbjT (DUF2867 family)
MYSLCQSAVPYVQSMLACFKMISEDKKMIGNSKATILAIAAAGRFGGLVLPEIAKRGAKVRGFVRNATQSDVARRHGAAEVAIGDLRDPASLAAALQNVGSVFYIAPAFMAGEAEVGARVVRAAAQAGVRRFVFSSVIHPTLSALVNHSAKAPVEEAILVSGMEYAFLQPTMFFQNFAESWPEVHKTGVLSQPWSIETRFTRVDYRDVAEVATIALTEDRLTFGTYELCADGALDRTEVAALMSEVLGRTITAGRSSSGNSPPAMKTMFEWYDTHGLLGNALVLRSILGREPRTLRAYFEELAARTADLR